MIGIRGAGPAGSAAAIAAIRRGAEVALTERCRFPRHKVCGEFLSPGIVPALERLGVIDAFLHCIPHRIRRMAVHIGRAEKIAALPESAFGLSRYTFDDLLLRTALDAGAKLKDAKPRILAAGRQAGGMRGARLFGFKAHFEGPTDDAVELYFLSGSAYIGVNCIERGGTNVCGLAAEHVLRGYAFEPEPLFSEALGRRLAPLRRTMDWMFTGPLEFTQCWTRTDVYLCGDALSFVDPFTGSGLVSAVLTGELAGRCAADLVPVREYNSQARALLARPFGFASVLREVAGTAWAERLIPFVPARLLFRVTRP